MSKVRFALVGCGRVSQKHVDAIRDCAGAELVAVCDVVEERAARLGTRCGVPYYVSYDRMLGSHDVDVVSILTPSGHHPRHAIDIITKYRKSIVCEKPMALKLSDADEMIETCNAYGVRLFVVKQNRYNLPVQKLREAVDQNRLGKLFLGTVRVRWCRKQDYYDADSWRGTWELDGGVLSNQASHHIDLLEWFLGEPISVMAKTGRYLAHIEAEDTAVAIIKFRSGAMGVVEATTAARPVDLEGSLSLLGSRGSVVIGGFAVNKLEVWNLSDESEDERRAVLQQFSEMPPNVYGFGHGRFLKEVVSAIKNNSQALIEGREGRKSLELINAIHESAETGREIFLKFEQQYSRLGYRSGQIGPRFPDPHQPPAWPLETL